jgi:TolA-binding protein
MTSGLNATRKVIAGLLLASAATALLPSAAAAQDDARVRKLEDQVRALQRAVFPGGDGRYFAPEVDTSRPQAPVQTTGPAASSTLTDVLARLDALEAQLARLTARGEENANELAQLKTELAEARVGQTAAEQPPVQVAGAQPTGVIPLPPATTTTTTSNRPAVTPAPTPSPTPPPAARPTAARLAAVQAIAKPSTDDAGDDEYTYGYRLWEAGFFPEARQQLSLYLQKYPRHEKVSYARNLLGRAYLDDGQPREAATHLLENYQKDKNGARAADSLLFLSEAMVAIADTNRACIALAEFSETYPALATGRLKEQYDRARSKVRCPR